MGEYTLVNEKIGSILKRRKNGGVYLGEEKIWRGHICGPPPLWVFLSDIGRNTVSR